MTNKRLTKSIKKFSKRKEDKLVTITGMLGLPLDGAKRVEVPNRDGFVFVRLKDNTSEVIQAYNSEVSNIYDLPVLVTRQNNVYKVIGRNLDLYRDWGNVPYLPKHGGQHSMNPSVGMGADVTWIYERQFMPQLAYPSGTASMMLTVNPHVYEWNGIWKYAQTTGTPSFAPFVPTITGSARMALFYINGNDNSLNIVAGSPFSNSIVDPPTLFSYLPDVPRSIGIPLAAVKLPTGTSYLDWTNIYDVRDFFTVGYGTSGSSGGAGGGSLGLIGLNEGILVGTGTSMNVVGERINLSLVSGSMFLLETSPDPQEQIGVFVQNEGTPLGTGTVLNFVGNGVHATIAGTTVTVAVTGTGGGAACGTYLRTERPTLLLGTVFQVPDRVYASGSLAYFYNGLLQYKGEHYEELIWVSGTFQLLFSPSTGSHHMVTYGVPCETQIYSTGSAESPFAMMDSDSVLLLDSDSVQLLDSDG